MMIVTGYVILDDSREDLYVVCLNRNPETEQMTGFTLKPWNKELDNNLIYMSWFSTPDEFIKCLSNSFTNIQLDEILCEAIVSGNLYCCKAERDIETNEVCLE